MKSKSLALILVFRTLLIVLGCFALAPVLVNAQTDDSFEITGWIPYWRVETGVKDTLDHLDVFTEVNPFMYTVTQGGKLHHASSLTKADWQILRTRADELGIRYIPTVMWANADAMDTIFRNPAKRQEHIRSIAHEVFTFDLDGIDIDYEAKYAKTRPYFSLFLKELKEAIGYNKWIMCTIEARTPLDSRYESPEDIPDDIEYANDFVEINKHCDRVRFMAYDQGRYDLKLNKEKSDPYAPVADTDWVEKTIRLALEDIDAKKILIGVPTYGYEYDMFEDLDGSGDIRYSRLWSFNPGYATDLAQQLGITPVRNNANEIMLVFPASQSPESIPLSFATRVLSWSDAESVRSKIVLAKKLGVRGISIFKIDGGQDPAILPLLSEYKGTRIGVGGDKKEIQVAMARDGAGTNLAAAALTLPNVDLEFNAKGEGVRVLQKFLNRIGYTVAQSGPGSPGNETPYFGPATTRALVNFQKKNNIQPSVGYFGPITRAYMHSL